MQKLLHLHQQNGALLDREMTWKSDKQPRPHSSGRMVNVPVFMCDQTPSRVSSHWNSDRSGLEVKRDILRQRHEIN